MLIVEIRLYFLLLQLHFDLTPNLAHFEVRVHLYNFHLLLFMCVEIIFVEAYPVEYAKYDEPDIVLFDLLFDPIDKVGLHASFREVL